ncbi:MAG: alpha/beta hydrolase [Methanosarcinales archaeon]|nr:alpha/beta hydrolase [Methanosarcinales archaeon]
MGTLRNDNILTLSDGRQLGYAEYGDPEGHPVFLFHGNPGSRLSFGLIPGSPFLPGIHIVAPDRPGYGLTDFRKNALIHWPDDVAELADHLGIEKFALFAPSGGGPFALACAWKIPEKISTVGIFGSVGPNEPEATKGVIRSVRLLWKISNPLFPIIKLQMRIMASMAKKDPEKMSLKLRDMELSEWDKKIFDRPEIKNIFKVDFPEAYRQNGIGSAYDVTIPARWPIPLEEISMKVHVWHAEPDVLVGNMSKYIACKLPNSQLYEIPNTGHLWILDHINEVLEILVPDQSRLKE